jgi:glycosyltransferase involved in cell wall biosynthesis
VKLGVITTSYPRFAGDPAGNFVAGHVGALRALGHDVEVIAAGTPNDTAGDTSDAPPAGDAVIRVGGARLFYRGGAPDALEHAPIRAGARAAVFTARLTARVTARAHRWDAIIAHWLVPSALAALPSPRPLIAIAHGGDVFTLRRMHLLRPVLRALHRRDARLVFVAEHLRAIARGAAPSLASWLDAAIVQPMGLPLARFAALVRAPSDPPIVLVAGRLVPIKGIDVAIAAMPHIRSGARLVIAGDGPERASPRRPGHTRCSARSPPSSATSFCAPPASSSFRRGSCRAAAPKARQRSRSKRSPRVCQSLPPRSVGCAMYPVCGWCLLKIRTSSPARSISCSRIRRLPSHCAPE